MKFGFRTPSLKKSFKARTSGRLKRSVKSNLIPTYGKKGMGYINNPKKAIYNKVYNKTTVSIFDVGPSKSRQRDMETINIPKDKIKFSHLTNLLTLTTIGLSFALVFGKYTSLYFLFLLVSFIGFIIFLIKDIRAYKREASLEKERFKNTLLSLSEDMEVKDLESLSLNELSFFTYNSAIDMVNRFNELINILDTSLDIDKYFSAWDEMEKLVEKMAIVDEEIKVLCTNCDDPLYMRNNFDFEKNRHNKVFVDKLIDKTKEDALVLKTQRGRDNRLIKMFENLLSRCDQMDDDVVNYISFQMMISQIA